MHSPKENKCIIIFRYDYLPRTQKKKLIAILIVESVYKYVALHQSNNDRLEKKNIKSETIDTNG